MIVSATMLAALLPLLVAPAVPLRLEIEAPARVRSGETLPVKVWLVNSGKTPVTVVAPSPMNGELGLRFAGDLYRGAKPVATNWTGRWAGQWEVVHQYDARAFTAIAPGARLALEDAAYRFEYVSGERPRLISRISTAPHRDLAPGAYVYRAKWSFAPRLAENDAALKAAHRSYPAQTLSPEGRRLYGAAWTGTLTAERAVTVVAP